MTIRKKSMKKDKTLRPPTGSQSWLHNKRNRRTINRIRLIRHRKEAKNKKTFEPYFSQTIELLGKENPYTAPEKKMLNAKIKVPKVFSIIEAPIDALHTIYTLASAGRAKSLYSVYTDHSEMEVVDLAAESIFDFIAIEIERERKRPNKRINFSGSYPANQDLKRYLKAIGIIKNLDIKHEMLDKSETSALRIFEMQSNFHAKSNQVDGSLFKEKVSKKFVDHINECLSDNGRQLTHEAIQLLSEYTSEILDNAEEHSGMEQWAISGYLDNSNDKHICEIAIFNFGTTIAESFEKLPRNSYARQEISPYIKMHSKSGWFSSSWQVEDLVTLIALQGHVSSKNKSQHDDRGQGTVHLIDFFQRVYNECTLQTMGAQMAILSGRTHILFDGRYRMEQNKDGRMIIAFNESNKLELPPDQKNIRNLGDFYFPGTIISIRFQMNKSQTEEIEQ